MLEKIFSGVIVSLVVTGIISIAKHLRRGFQEHFSHTVSGESSEAYVLKVKRQFKFCFLSAVTVIILLLNLELPKDHTLSVILYVVGGLLALLSFMTFYCLDDVVDQLRKQLSDNPSNHSANYATDSNVHG